MEASEIVRRNTALALYMGLKTDYTPEECMGFSPIPYYHEDMNLLMPVVWKLQDEEGCQFVLDSEKCYVMGKAPMRFPRKLFDVVISPALALWEAVSSLVMELQEQQKGV